MKKKSSIKTQYLSYYLIGFLSIIVLSLGLVIFRGEQITNNLPFTVTEIEAQDREAERISKTIFTIQTKLEQLQNEDQLQTAGANQRVIEKLKGNLTILTTEYEDLLDLRYNGVRVDTKEDSFTVLLDTISNKDLALADTQLNDLVKSFDIESTNLFSLAVIAAGAAIPSNVQAVNQAPSSGYRRQRVSSGGRSYLVDIVAADLNSNKVIVDTASNGTCNNDCPVLPLASYVSRNGAFAGINGSYFCPASYPSCSSKKNSFDILVMNKNKTYFNSDNNVYSTVPAAIFSQGSARFVSASRDWGRDTGVDAVIANRPLLVLDGNLMFAGGGESKEEVRGNRGFLGASGNIAYIGVVRNASVAEAAKVLQTMGIKSAINLDSGGSLALWSGGYKMGPGRAIPNSILFVRR